MLLRSSSTPILGSLLSSFSDTPKKDFDTSPFSIPDSFNHHHKKISFSHGGHPPPPPPPPPNLPSFSCNSSPITPSFESSSRSSIRRAQSDGNLQGLIADMDEFIGSKPPLKSSRKPHHSMLESIPSFSIYSKNGQEGDEEEEEEEEDGEGVFLIRSITIGDNISGLGIGGEFSFGNNMELIEEEEGNEFSGLSGVDEDGHPKSPPMYLARGLGVDMGFGGGEDDGDGDGDFGLSEYGGDRENMNMEEYYKQMVEENPGNSLVLRNYAHFLYQSKGDLQGAEEYYSRAILSDPGDGDMLSQYAKIVWELHHDHERAASYFERAVDVAPEDSHVHAAYASFLWETEDEEEEESFQQEHLGGISISQTRTMASASA